MTRNNRSAVTVENAGHYFFNGFHCAESVVAAVADHVDKVDSTKRETALCCATGFGGGFGKSFDEVCGVISGAVIAIGVLYGRSEQGNDWDIPAAMAARFRQDFLSKHGTTHCGELRKRFGEEKQMAECQKLVCEGVLNLLQLIEDQEAAIHQETSQE